MNKKDIRIKLREALDELFNVAEVDLTEREAPAHANPHKASSEEEPASTNAHDKNGKKDYSDVQAEFNKLGGPSMVDVMKIMGISDDEKGVNRSLFRKKVKQEINKQNGSRYQFDDKELAQVRTALKNRK